MRLLRLAATVILLSLLLLDVIIALFLWNYGPVYQAVSGPDLQNPAAAVPAAEWIKAVLLFGAQPCLAYLVWRLWKPKLAKRMNGQ
jgi:hypothetical protein